VIRTTIDTRRPLAALVLGLSGLAWLALWAWGNSPSASFLSHVAPAHLASSNPVALAWICMPGALAGQPGGPALLLVFLAGWLLMIVAMMLPTSLPLIAMFQTITRQHPQRRQLIALLIVGYLAVWLASGVVTHAGYEAWYTLVARTSWLRANAWSIGAGVVLIAGVYQLTPLKYYGLDRCRSPLSFIAAHWRGGSARLQALQLGLHHGLFCVGCCWSIMLLMFVVGSSNLGWMLALGAVMAIEKNVPWGRRISAPLGGMLLTWGLILVLGAVIG
jgi:predicted metal-binding membrane protein